MAKVYDVIPMGDKNDYFYNDDRKKVLEAIYRGKRQLVEIEHESKLSKPTIIKHINELKEQAFITYEGAFNKETGRAAGAELTPTGELEYQRLVKNNWQIHHVRSPTIVQLPIYSPESCVSGSSIVSVTGSHASQQELERYREIMFETGEKIRRDCPHIGTADNRWELIPEKKETKKE